MFFVVFPGGFPLIRGSDPELPIGNLGPQIPGSLDLLGSDGAFLHQLPAFGTLRAVAQEIPGDPVPKKVGVRGRGVLQMVVVPQFGNHRKMMGKYGIIMGLRTGWCPSSWTLLVCLEVQ